MKRQDRAEYIREAERAARHLGLPAHGPSTDLAIVDYCRRQVSLLVDEHGLPSTMDDLLDRVAGCLDVEIVEIHSDEDMRGLLQRIPPSEDPAMALVQAELTDGTDAITIRRRDPGPWRRYLAVINCRGQHYYRRFFSKWHELTHRLVDGEQLKFAFRQTLSDRKDPGEILVDKVAGELAFFPDIVGPRAQECLRRHGLTFEAVDELRRSVAPEASREATALALMRHSGQPAWYLRCAVSLKHSEARTAGRRNGGSTPVPRLRVQDAYPNDLASECSTRIHQWMRVPEGGLIARVRMSGVPETGTEPLDEWETSDGGPIGSGRVLVDARVVGDQVLALVSGTA